ncbi:factor of DNA methylation 4-like [Syzygium oleosum]|uniref:factor of DNA methylation 4-like n=1 Tax=Syzygium oleosum TaxID=219896 RepID=UPI0024BA0BF5|nr:factor of DNA methylation 4-like [Syzygium oleosum]XP_056165286.1 factor of DNA methylation 4-like [Syzygium oleosum]
MSRREDKGTRKRRSELEEYEDRYYQELKGRSIRINVSDSLYKCPFCRSAQRRDYCYEDLLKHASRISKDSKGISTKEIGKHLALERYLRKHFSRKVNAEDSTNIGLSSAKNDQQLRLSSAKNDQQLRLSSAKNDQQFVWPWMGVIANIKTEVKDGRFVGESGTKLREELEKKGFNPVRVQPLWNYQGHSGLAVVEFNKDWVGFCNAIAFEKSYETERRGRRDFYVSKDRGDKPFGWLAYDDDYYSKGILGDHLRKKGHLRTLSDKEAEEQRKRSMLVADLQKTLEIKSSRLLEMESKYNETKHSLDNLVTQKDEMLRAHNEEIKKMQQNARNNLEKIYLEHDNVTLHLQAQKRKLQQREQELELREFQNEGKRAKLRHDREMVERAFLEQQKVDNNFMRLAEDQKSEKEKLHRKIFELERKLDDKQSLELEIERMRGALQVMKHMEDDEDVDLKQKMKEIEESLKEKEEEMEFNEELSQTLIVKERKTNDELQDARKELIKTLRNNTSRAMIGVKRMGELDSKPFLIAAKRKFAAEEANEKAIMLCSKWEDHLRDPEWYPFKGITDGEHRKEIIDEEDEKLKALKDEYGDEVFKAVSKAIEELNEYNGSGRYIVPELWHFREGRKASLKEGVAYLLKQWKPRKKRN